MRGSGSEEILVDPPLVTEQGRTIADDKARMSALLAEAGLRTPRFVALRGQGDIDTTVEAAAELRWPLVVKPLRGRQGLGVTLNVTSAAELRALKSDLFGASCPDVEIGHITALGTPPLAMQQPPMPPLCSSVPMAMQRQHQPP